MDPIFPLARLRQRLLPPPLRSSRDAFGTFRPRTRPHVGGKAYLAGRDVAGTGAPGGPDSRRIRHHHRGLGGLHGRPPSEGHLVRDALPRRGGGAGPGGRGRRRHCGMPSPPCSRERWRMTAWTCTPDRTGPLLRSPTPPSPRRWMRPSGKGTKSFCRRYGPDVDTGGALLGHTGGLGAGLLRGAVRVLPEHPGVPGRSGRLAPVRHSAFTERAVSYQLSLGMDLLDGGSGGGGHEDGAALTWPPPG